MNKKQFALRGAVYECEIGAAMLGHGIAEYQTKSKLAEKLQSDGLLAKTQSKFKGVTVEGYTLADLGRMTFCMQCDGDEE